MRLSTHGVIPSQYDSPFSRARRNYLLGDA